MVARYPACPSLRDRLADAYKVNGKGPWSGKAKRGLGQAAPQGTMQAPANRVTPRQRISRKRQVEASIRSIKATLAHLKLTRKCRKSFSFRLAVLL